jgi:predicted ATPase
MVPEGFQQDQLHNQIGMHVWRHYASKKDANPGYIFLAADQLNRGSSHVYHDEDRIFLVEINYKASLAAKSKVGIETVSMFIDRALEQVSALSDSTTCWEENYKLFLDLYSFAAEVEFCRGNFDRNAAHIDVVVAYARRKEDAIRVLLCRSQAYGVRREFLQAIKEEKKLLKLLGVKMPRSYTINFLREVIKAKRAVKAVSDADILEMKPMKDDNMKLAMKILKQGRYLNHTTYVCVQQGVL